MSAARVGVRVTPKADRDEVRGWRQGELEVRVTAAPDAGKANAAVCRLIADALRVPKGNVCVVRGQASRHKLVEITDAADSDIESAFGKPRI